jgi:hypothetical protein
LKKVELQCSATYVSFAQQKKFRTRTATRHADIQLCTVGIAGDDQSTATPPPQKSQTFWAGHEKQPMVPWPARIFVNSANAVFELTDGFECTVRLTGAKCFAFGLALTLTWLEKSALCPFLDYFGFEPLAGTVCAQVHGLTS